jgi:uncharacterized protein with NRDE domain
MCVVSIAWAAHPKWRLVVAGNRDEYHARASAPLGRWHDAPQVIAGRDLVSDGTWMGVSESGRFAVVTNIHDPQGPDATRLSRGALVSDFLVDAIAPDDPDQYNPFNLIVLGPDGLACMANRPVPYREMLAAGIHGLSNAIPGENWPRKDRLVGMMRAWLDEASDDPALLLSALANRSVPDDDGYPIFIANPVYGTRCSTVIAVDHSGNGRIIERCFDEAGTQSGEVSMRFEWSPTIS